MLLGSQLLAEMIMPTTSSLGQLLHTSRFQCSFETPFKCIFARAMPLDIGHTVFGGMEFDLLQTNL
jgi:RsiW-degrading membrane proteinase PrsW (M82 family)